MSSRSLRVAPEHINELKLALKRNQFHTQDRLAKNMGIARSTISKFFNGKPVDSQNFVEICEKLKLSWETIVDEEYTNSIPDTDQGKGIDALVEEVREKVKPFIKEHYSSMQVLDMTQPIGLNDIYTKVNILEEITGRRRIEFVDLVQGFDPAKFDRFGLGIITEERKPGLDAVEEYSKLLVLGKPGSGKTTFLKHLAIECNDGRFLGELVPIFITLKDFAEAENKPFLLEYITQQLSRYKSSVTELESLLENGKILVLLDGLDEVRQEDNNRVLKQIREFSKQYYMNRFVMTCRIAAQ
jgi:predicted NACHT family NTPase